MNGFKATQSLFGFTISADAAAKYWAKTEKHCWKNKSECGGSKTYKAEVELNYSKTTKTTQVSNVLALLEGTDKKEEYVVITAHYDHIGTRNDTTIYYGADDDGSGTTGILELAQAFVEAKKAGKGPKREVSCL
ncbi:MAG: M28 family peptidase [Saprospiraceae bacterium]|nr:M28 family peptidase [Saprospiraceae bacterium]